MVTFAAVHLIPFLVESKFRVWLRWRSVRSQTFSAVASPQVQSVLIPDINTSSSCDRGQEALQFNGVVFQWEQFRRFVWNFQNLNVHRQCSKNDSDSDLSLIVWSIWLSTSWFEFTQQPEFAYLELLSTGTLPFAKWSRKIMLMKMNLDPWLYLSHGLSDWHLVDIFSYKSNLLSGRFTLRPPSRLSMYCCCGRLQ